MQVHVQLFGSVIEFDALHDRLRLLCLTLFPKGLASTEARLGVGRIELNHPTAILERHFVILELELACSQIQVQRNHHDFASLQIIALDKAPPSLSLK